MQFLKNTAVSGDDVFENQELIQWQQDQNSTTQESILNVKKRQNYPTNRERRK